LTKSNQVTAIGTWLTRTVSLISGGIVVFFAGYAYLSELAAKGTFQHLKNHFVEPKSAAEVETILSKFTQAISDHVKCPNNMRNGNSEHD